jgi:16S rRNA (uracil1498-N3)-methyltransferase
VLSAQQATSLQPSESQSVFYADGSGQSMSSLVDASCSNIMIAIGPEGGFSAAEVAHFETVGIQAIRLGDNILRTEAASVAAVSQWTQIRMQFEC